MSHGSPGTSGRWHDQHFTAPASTNGFHAFRSARYAALPYNMRSSSLRANPRHPGVQNL
jgi:hypothetical protein